MNNFNIVADEPPAPAALVESGCCSDSLVFLSATFFLLTALLKPPGAAVDDCFVSIGGYSVSPAFSLFSIYCFKAQKLNLFIGIYILLFIARCVEKFG